MIVPIKAIAFAEGRKNLQAKISYKLPKKMERKDQQRHAFAAVAVLKKEFL